LEDVVTDRSFWKGKRVFLTGHTGFKGSWLSLWLANKGAVVRGFALDPASEPNLFTTAKVSSKIDDIRGDIRTPGALDEPMRSFKPEIVFHMAAQPLVRESYRDPIGTYETNAIGTARLLEAVRHTSSAKAVVCVTTDKCYENKEWLWGYRETDPLGGYDPYSNSKACAELISSAYRQSFFPLDKHAEHGCGIASARAGNVIGGGDWSTDRLIPDLIRGFETNQPVLIRNPAAIRPWQHVLEPLSGYMRLAELLAGDGAVQYATAFNFGPSDDDAKPVSWIADKIKHLWGGTASWTLDEALRPHEAGYLKLDSSRARSELGWRPRLTLEQAIEWIIEWHQSFLHRDDMEAFTLSQILRYEGL
jgi:CDP-glucose 4,6-dehydratase